MEQYREANKSMSVFFRCMGVGLVLSALHTDLSDVSLVVLLKNLLLTFAYNLIIGIWFGLANMFVIDLYFYLKNKQ